MTVPATCHSKRTPNASISSWLRSSTERVSDAEAAAADAGPPIRVGAPRALADKPSDAC
jgi:hypothetical protein